MSHLEAFARYSRQMLVPQIGRKGQERLAAARVGVMGCGALGSVVASHLVRCGVGFVRLIDKDGPEIHNLHRQILYTERDVALGTPKVEAAAAFLQAANSEVVVEPVVEVISSETLPRLAADLDLVVDGTDNFPTRFAINEYAVSRGMPWVYGGVITTTGMCMTIVPGQGPCLRCLVRELPPPEQAPTAAVAGVLSTIVGVIGSIEANEAIKLIVDPAARSCVLVAVDVWDLVFERLEIPRDPTCPCCGSAVSSKES